MKHTDCGCTDRGRAIVEAEQQGKAESGQYSVPVNLIVKARSQDDAMSLVAQRLNAWFIEDSKVEPPYPYGSLLFWGHLKEYRNP